MPNPTVPDLRPMCTICGERLDSIKQAHTCPPKWMFRYSHRETSPSEDGHWSDWLPHFAHMMPEDTAKEIGEEWGSIASRIWTPGVCGWN